jgi:Hemerythrin HHE cation binding domain
MDGSVTHGHVTAMIASAHSDAQALIGAAGPAGGAGPDPGDPRVGMRVFDAAVAAVTAHLCAMRTVFYPDARRRGGDAPAAVATLTASAREMASVMRGMEQYLNGDTHQPSETLSELRVDLAALFDTHVAVEEGLIASLEAGWSPAERDRATARIEKAMRHAPTRPHPHLPRSGPMLAPAVRVSAQWDHVLDTLDARAVAGRPIRQPGPPGLWGWYLLGRGTAPDPQPRSTKP